MATQSLTPSKIQQPLLYSRDQARQLLGGVSRHTLWRLEKAGKLHAVHLNRRSSKARVFYRHDEIMSLVGQPTPDN